jgi:hypothetical protein
MDVLASTHTGAGLVFVRLFFIDLWCPHAVHQTIIGEPLGQHETVLAGGGDDVLSQQQVGVVGQPRRQDCVLGVVDANAAGRHFVLVAEHRLR